jgi:hypothetical protein
MVAALKFCSVEGKGIKKEVRVREVVVNSLPHPLKLHTPLDRLYEGRLGGISRRRHRSCT